MTVGRAILVLVLLVLIGLPIAIAPREKRTNRETGATARDADDAHRIVVFTPHNEQIRQEFADAFGRWHETKFGEHVEVSWRQPGGTSEIRKMLESAYLAQLKRTPSKGVGDNETLGGNADLLFGGGSYEFIQMAKELSVETPSGKRSTTVLAPLDLDQEFLDATYGAGSGGAPPTIGDVPLYDAKRMWFGTALSGFGIVYNPSILERLGVPAPQHWADLCDPRLRGWVVLVNPSQSGSVTTAFEAIMQRRGWQVGWQILRRMAANARSFAASAPRAPTDVSLGDAAAGVCIDFYGRFQAQAMEDATRDATHQASVPRVGYVDPAGETVIDPDPIALLRGAPNPVLARRFVEFVLSREGQALWQFHAKSRLATRPADNLGPETYEVRRMPVRRELYVRDFDRFVDQVDPFALATAVEKPDRNFRAFLPSMFVAMAIDNRELLRAAWNAIVEHPAYPRDGRIVLAGDVSDSTLRAMLERFDALPSVDGPDGTTFDLSDPAALGPVREGWLKSGWSSARLWPTDAIPAEVLRSRMTAFFRAQYEGINDLAHSGLTTGAAP
ncbi:MAG: extracellular solute-binding protein [Phycisphaerae bacterium]|nr:extracellular solute-binding protein [Phycisphaerae bacterium]